MLKNQTSTFAGCSTPVNLHYFLGGPYRKKVRNKSGPTITWKPELNRMHDACPLCQESKRRHTPPRNTGIDAHTDGEKEENIGDPECRRFCCLRIAVITFFQSNPEAFLVFLFLFLFLHAYIRSNSKAAAEATIHLQLRILELSSSNSSGSCSACGVKSRMLLRSPARRTGGDLAAPPTTHRPPRRSSADASAPSLLPDTWYQVCSSHRLNETQCPAPVVLPQQQCTATASSSSISSISGSISTSSSSSSSRSSSSRSISSRSSSRPRDRYWKLTR